MTAIVIGESLVDVVVGVDGTQRRRPGGSPLNVAVGLGRLGVATELVTAVGPDADGQLLRRHAEASGVRFRNAGVVAKTSTAVARLAADGTATYDIDLHWTLPALTLELPSVLHVGSLAAVVTPGCDVVAEVVRDVSGRALVCLDPNCRPGIPPQPVALERVSALIGFVDVLKLSIDDVNWLWPASTLDEVVHDALGRGVRLVVVTRGPRETSAWTARTHVEVPPVAGGAVIDTIGAGDAFTAAMLARLAASTTALADMTGSDVERVLQFASLAGRRTCERAGADPPWQAELEG